VRLPNPRRPEEQDILAIGDEPPGGEFLDDLRLDRGLELPVEALERLLEREPRHHDPHRLVLLLLGGELAGEHVIQEVGVADILLRRLFEQRTQFGVEPMQAEALVVRTQALQLGRRHGVTSPTSVA